jgi:hypothetical protein
MTATGRSRSQQKWAAAIQMLPRLDRIQPSAPITNRHAPRSPRCRAGPRGNATRFSGPRPKKAVKAVNAAPGHAPAGRVSPAVARAKAVKVAKAAKVAPGFATTRPTISPSPRKKGGEGGEAGGRARDTAFTTFTAFRRPPPRARVAPSPDRRRPPPRRTPRPKTRAQGTRPGRRKGGGHPGPAIAPPRTRAAPTRARPAPRDLALADRRRAPAAHVSRSPPESPRPRDASGRTPSAGDSARRMTRRSHPPETTGGCRRRGRP